MYGETGGANDTVFLPFDTLQRRNGFLNQEESNLTSFASWTLQSDIIYKFYANNLLQKLWRCCHFAYLCSGFINK